MDAAARTITDPGDRMNSFVSLLAGVLWLPATAELPQLAAFTPASLSTAALASPSTAQGAQSGQGGQGGEADFDFSLGTWRTEVSVLLERMSGSDAWAEYEGTSIVHSFLDGRTSMVELDVEGPAGRIRGLNLRLYDPQVRQWSLYYASGRSGTMSPPVTGEFRDGRGLFYGQETVNGRSVLVRFVITNLTPDSWRYEQAFSDDGGETWEMNWIATDTLISD